MKYEGILRAREAVDRVGHPLVEMARPDAKGAL